MFTNFSVYAFGIKAAEVLILSFLFRFAGDLYGAIGSPVRLSRTVVVGRRQDLVQRLLYVLTYFIRCSELLETHMLDSAEDEAIVMPGSLITTSLRKGEVEESDYVLVTVHKPSGDYLSQGANSQQTEAEDSSCPSDNSLQSSTYTDTEMEHNCREMLKEKMDKEEYEEYSNNSQGSRSSVLLSRPTEGAASVITTAEAELQTLAVPELGELKRESSSPLASEVRVETVLQVGSACPKEQGHVLDTETKGDIKLIPSTHTVPPSSPSNSSATVDRKTLEASMESEMGGQPRKVQALQALGISLEKKPPDKNLVGAVPIPVIPGKPMPGPMALSSAEEEEPATKVTFLIGDSMSPESDTESRQRKMQVEIKKYKKLMENHPSHLQPLHQQQQYTLPRGAHSKTSNTSASEDQTKPTKATPALQRVSSKMPQWNLNSGDDFDEYFSSENPVELRTIDDVAKHEATTTDITHKHLLNPSGIPRLHDPRDHSCQSVRRGQALGICLGSDVGEVESSKKGNTLSDVRRRCRCGSTDSSDACCRSRPAEQDQDIVLTVPAPQDGGSDKDQKRQVAPLNDWEIPRNESSDSALGDSESEETEDWQEEVLVPFPG